MSISPLLAALTLLLVTLQLFTNTALSNARLNSQMSAIAINMQIYKHAVDTYAANNATATGTVADTSLSLPSWFNHFPMVLNYVDTGKGYVYVVSPPAGLTAQLLQVTHHAGTVGIKQGGYLINPDNPNNYTSPTPLPSAIPDGALVSAF